MKHRLITFIFLLTGSVVFGQEKYQLSLADAQNYALEHNKTLQSAQMDITLSEKKLKESIAQGLPQIDGSIDYTTYFGYEMVFEILGYSSTIEMTNASTAKVQLGQLIFSGQYWAGIQLAKLGEKIAEQGYKNSILDIKESIVSSYLMALVTERSIEITKKSNESLEEIKGHTNMMYKTGMAKQTDVDQIGIQVSMLSNNLHTMERSLKLAYSMLKFQMGLNPSDEIELTDDLETLLATISPEAELGNFDVTNNLNYQLVETQTDMSQKKLDMEKWNYAPTISGYYAYNEKLLTTGFDMTPDHVAGLSVSIPIFSSGSRKNKVAQAKIELEKAEINKSIVKEQLEIQKEQLSFDLNSAIENYEAQKQNVEVAKRVFNNVKRQYEEGMASSFDLTQSNNDHLQAESNFTQAMMSLLQAKVALDKLYNQL